MTLIEDAAQLVEGSRELALAGAALALAGLALTPICTMLVRRLSPKAPVFFARWRFFHAALALVVLVAASQFAPMFVRFVLPPHSELTEIEPLLANVCAFAATSAVILALAARLDPDGISSLGLRANGSARAAIVGLCCYVLLVPGLFGLQLLWPWLLERLGGEYQAQTVAVGLEHLSGSSRWCAALIVIGVVPFFEELVFRGFLQPLLVQNLGDRGGVFLTSLTFAIPHGDSAFLPIFGLALILGSLKLRTQRLSACYCVHALHNGIAFLLLGYPGNG